jgi:predicted O-methyltransferase YrrM
MFENPAAFDPDRDSKMPLVRTPMALALRAMLLMGSLLFSKHPQDLWTWLRSMRARRRPLSFPIPWLTFDAIRLITPALGAGGRVFEYGSGHSTLYWLQRKAEVVTLEDNEGWFNALRNVAGSDSPQLTMLLAKQKSDYIDAIHRYPKAHFDVVLVDGSYRRDCVLAAIEHVKPGGLLVVDNTDWHWFRSAPIDGIPVDWRKSVHAGYAPMLGHKTETSIWRRPARSASVHD